MNVPFTQWWSTARIGQDYVFFHQEARRMRFPTITACILLMIALPAAAQTGPTSGSDRLFLNFAEEATVVETQWWEGQINITDHDPADARTASLVFALNPVDRVEFGGKVGFGSTDTPAGVPDGSGATDLTLWGKYHLGTTGDDTEFAAGTIVTVPTGDDTAGLGYDSFGVGAFWSFRQVLPKAILSGNAGVRFNDDGRIFGVELEGKTSGFAGLGVITPLSDRLSAIGEARYEAKRFEGGDSDFSILAGINWRPENRGMVRVAIAFGLADGSPDAQLLAGYAVSF
jgi:hypothetical protein